MELPAVPAAPHRRRPTLGRTCSLRSVARSSPCFGLHLNQARPHPSQQFSKWEPRKINPESVANLSPPRRDHQDTTVDRPLFSKTLAKIPETTPQNFYQPRLLGCGMIVGRVRVTPDNEDLEMSKD